MWSWWLGLVLNEQRQLYDRPEVVVPVDAGFVELAVQIVLEAADYNMWIHSEDCYEWTVGVCVVAAPK